MKKIIALVAFCVAVASPACLHAQKMSKEEAKRLQSELKALAKSPEKLKAQKAESDELSTTENMRNVQFIDMKSKLKKQETDLKKLDDDILTSKLELDKLSVALQAPQNGNVTAPKKEAKGNVVIVAPSRALYRTQIGAYQSLPVMQAVQNEQFEIEPMDNGMKRFMVGKFNSYQEAVKFTQKLRRIGAQAYVVGYLDSKRLGNLKEMPVEFMQK